MKLFVDIETTGLDPVEDDIIEIGCILTDKNFKVLDLWSDTIKPVRWWNKKEEYPFSRLKNEDLNLSLHEAMMKFLEFFNQCEELYAHNVSFDVNFLNVALNRIKKGSLFNEQEKRRHFYCTKVIAECSQWLQGLESYSLKSLCSYLGIERARDHRAIDDAMACVLLMKHLKG